MEQTDKGRCVHCRVDIVVPASYTQGDHIKCGSCGTKHKVVRGEKLRLVLADPTPIKEALQANRERIGRLEDELRGARRSFGLGINGLGVGVIYLLVQLAYNNASLTRGLIVTSLFVAVVTGVLMELANSLFLAKRQRIHALTQEIEMLEGESRQLDQRLREATRL